MADKEWSEDPEDDPVELQKQQLALGKEFLARLRKEDEEKKAREAEYANASPRPAGAPTYNPPTFEEVSVVLKKAWDEVERIMPTATDQVKTVVFNTLMHAAAPPPAAFLGYAS
jgi:hypothetical protein